MNLINYGCKSHSWQKNKICDDMPKRLIGRSLNIKPQHLPLLLLLLNYTCLFTCSTLLAHYHENIFVVPSTAASHELLTVAAAYAMPPPSSSELPSKGVPAVTKHVLC